MVICCQKTHKGGMHDTLTSEKQMKNKGEAIVCAVKQVIDTNPLVWAVTHWMLAIFIHRQDRAKAKSYTCDHCSKSIQVSGSLDLRKYISRIKPDI